jgi:ribosomal protein S18 acetylase RimI-like enzyme
MGKKRRLRPVAPPLTIRAATPQDLPACARLGARLSRMHHRLDPRRFFLPPGIEDGYRWWLGKELENRRAVVLAAVAPAARGREAVVGYAYGRLAPRDWNTLRDACGVGVDLMVEPRWRRRGLGTRLVEALAAALASRGAPRLVLQVASRNPEAARAFEGMGFRPTVLELTRELPRPRQRRDPPAPVRAGRARPAR